MNNKVFVGGFPYQTTEDQLADLFSEVGDVMSVRIITDRESGRSRGFGFIEMSSSDYANKAIERFHGYDLNGRQLAVNIAQDRRPRAQNNGSFNNYSQGNQRVRSNGNRW
ncbi:MAG: RNA-binding protein [Zetaproteobacteria bacterium]|nr:RNA-binding protein [Pseudobdellovibrionaceae bacterium]|tara:strand:- start:45 stop:374 length:330 start_codon:yes stop_codon:yes gene_type:complete